MTEKPNYYRDEQVLLSELVEQLRAAVDRSCIVTFRKEGPLTVTEQRLPLALVEAIRLTLHVDSIPVYVAKPRDDSTAATIQALAGQHSPAAIATALGVDRTTVYRNGGDRARNAPRGDRTSDPSALIAGLAAIRRREKLDQRLVAGTLGIAVSTLSETERLEPSDPERAEALLRAIAQNMRVGMTHLRRQALEVGAALRDVRKLAPPADVAGA